MSTIKGDPNIFAVEFEVTTYSTPYLFGYAQLWIQGVPFGDFAQEIVLSSLIGALEDVCQCDENADFLKLNDQDLFDLIYNGEFDNSPYFILQCENFDSFSRFSFTVGEELHILWRLHEDTSSQYLANYPRGIFHKKVKISVFEKITREFDNTIMDLEPANREIEVGYHPRKSVLPENDEELWKMSVEDPASTRVRWTKVGHGKDSVYHRFQSDTHEVFHWNGSTEGKTKSGKSENIELHRIPKKIRKLPRGMS